ncbi:hypothetical protein [Paraburkholderia sp. BL17N1]|uniref:hypothetical protein n=1 Tax=Paraburkholderia sp. BL17N1 TaxID=1938798 RepID=UPI000EB002E4|nr:hypothetical protein [Paraburkholderia sp. BL17N1]RKR38993.1 hypothetical protein B0G82_7164 [Paraburkholderia sp. BL17N1]
MYNDTDSPKSVLDGQHAGGQASGLSNSATPPPRFGRLAMCMAAASALAIGVLGTVAYSVWFNHDQQAYAEAMAGARRALGNGVSANAAVAAVMAKNASATAVPAAIASAKPVPALPSSQVMATSGATTPASPAGTDPEAGGQFASWSGEVKAKAFAAQPVRVANVASGTSASTAPPPTPARRSANASAAPTQQVAASHPGKDGRAAPQERRAPENARHKNNLFARMGLFFRRVNYRQHGNANRQDIYSHP